MKKMFFMSFLVVATVVAGIKTQASASQPTLADDPCFVTSSPWYPCPPNGLQIAAYPIGDGLYAYYAWQCASFNCPLN